MKKTKKLLIAIMTIIVMGMLFTSCSGKKGDQEEVNVYNWGSYIDPDVLKDFEKETGIKVVYDTFTMNEDLYIKLKQGGNNYDVIVPSDYMIERMISEDMLEKLNFENIPNHKKIDQEFLNQDYDPKNEYSVPYFWGTVGIVYNKEMVKEPVDSWNILWNPKYEQEILMMDSSRDSLGVALKKLGYSMNTRDEKELMQAKEELIRQKPLVQAYQVDEMKDNMIGENSALAVMYSGDAMDALRENENLAYAIPKEGSNIWFDAMVIPKGAKNKTNAEKFIDYMCRPEVAAKNAEMVGYSIPIKEGRELLSEESKNSEVSYPDLSKVPPLEVYRNPADVISLYEQIWADVKAE